MTDETEPQFRVGDRIVVWTDDDPDDIPDRLIHTITRRLRDIDTESIVYAVERYPDLESGPKPDLRNQSDLIENYTVLGKE